MDLSDSWASPPSPPTALTVVADYIPGASAASSEEGLWEGIRHPSHSAAYYLISIGVPRLLTAQSRALNSLLLLNYPPPPPVPMTSHPSLGGGKSEGRLQKVQHSDGLPSGTLRRDDASLR